MILWNIIIEKVHFIVKTYCLSVSACGGLSSLVWTSRSSPYYNYYFWKISCYLEIINYKKFLTNFASNLCLQIVRAIQLSTSALQLIPSLVLPYFWKVPQAHGHFLLFLFFHGYLAHTSFIFTLDLQSTTGTHFFHGNFLLFIFMDFLADSPYSYIQFLTRI